jgi:RimJ/RimL family protein N-acetyltransferase
LHDTARLRLHQAVEHYAQANPREVRGTSLRRYWRARVHWKPGSWHLPLALHLDERPIGIRDIWASDFARVRSGRHRVLDHPQRARETGTAPQAGAAVLELAFGQLGAEEACTEYPDGNHASEKVSRKLGYTATDSTWSTGTTQGARPDTGSASAAGPGRKTAMARPASSPLGKAGRHWSPTAHVLSAR